MDEEFVRSGSGCQISYWDGNSFVGKDNTYVVGNKIRMSFSEESAVDEAQSCFHPFIRCRFVDGGFQGGSPDPRPWKHFSEVFYGLA